MTESPVPLELITRFKSQPVGISEVELVKIVESLQGPSRSRGVVVGITLSSIVALSVAAFILLMPTSPRVNEFSPKAQRLPVEGSVVSPLGNEPFFRSTAPVVVSMAAATEPIQPRFGQCVLLTPQEISDLGVEVTDSSIILHSELGTSEYLKEYSQHHFGQTSLGSTTHAWIEPVVIVSEDGKLLRYQNPQVQPEQIPIRHDSNIRQIVELRIDWDDPKREKWLRESRDDANNSDSTTAFRYIFMTKEQTDSFRLASHLQSLQAQTNTVRAIEAGKLIPLRVRLARTDSQMRTPDVTLWYKPTDDFLQKLPPGFASAIRSELRGNRGSCTYTTSCLEVGTTLQLINVHFDPTSELVRLELRSTTEQHVVFKLFNTIGVPVGSVSLDAVEGINSLHIPIAQGNHGLIFLTAKSTSGEQVTSRVFIGPR